MAGARKIAFEKESADLKQRWDKLSRDTQSVLEAAKRLKKKCLNGHPVGKSGDGEKLKAGH